MSGTQTIGRLPLPVALLAAAVVIQYLLVGLNAVEDDRESWWTDVASLPERVVAKTTRELAERFSNYGYGLEPGVSPRRPVPRALLSELPKDWGSEWTPKEKKSAFIAVMLPIVLAENARIERLRHRLLDDEGDDADWRTDLAQRYGLKTADREALLKRIDTIPPSLAIAQAAIESGWGRSRFAREGNALFGQWTWDASNGIKPQAREEGKTHFIRAFPDLSASVRSYVKNLNTHPAYGEFRALRQKLRRHNSDISGPRLAETLVPYSTKGEAYVADVQQIIRHERLTRFDGASLAEND